MAYRVVYQHRHENDIGEEGYGPELLHPDVFDTERAAILFANKLQCWSVSSSTSARVVKESVRPPDQKAEAQ